MDKAHTAHGPDQPGDGRSNSEALFRAIFDTAQDSIFVKDRSLKYTLVNPAMAKLFNLSAAQLIGKTDQQLFGQEAGAHIHLVDQRVLDGEIIEENPLKPVGGVMHSFHTIKTPLRDAAGAIVGLVGIARDTTARSQAEKALHESQERYRTLYQNATIGLYRTAPDGRILLANPALARMLGFDSSEELVRLNIEADHLEPSAERDRFRAFMEEVGEIKGHEAVWNRRDGSPVFVRESARAIRDDSGQIIYYEGSAEDITEKKQAEDALRQAELKYRMLVEQSPAVTYIDDVDKAATALFVSPQIETLTGYSPQEWLADNDLWHKIIHPADRSRVLASHRRTNASGDTFNEEYRILARDGRVIWVRDETILLRDQAGLPQCWQGVMVDISERKRAEEALLRAETKYRALVEQIPAVTYVAVLDDASVTIFISPQIQNLIGYSAAEYMETPGSWIRVLHPEDRDSVLAENLRAHNNHQPFNMNYRMIARDGRVVWVHDQAALVFEADGSKPVWQGIIQDITERKLAEQRLQAALQEKEVLLREIHHRVKNNPTVVSSLLDLQANASQDERVRVAFKNSQGHIQTMASIHEQLYRSGNLAQVDMAKYITDLVEKLYFAYSFADIKVNFDLDQIRLSVDQAIPCGLILNELLTNAFKYAFAGDSSAAPVINISLAAADPPPGTEPRPTIYTLKVSDNGLGLPADMDLAAACSLGWRLVNGLIGQLHGQLEVESAPGAGACFTIAFPSAE